MMHNIDWHDDFNTGIQAVDDDHHDVIRDLNLLLQAYEHQNSAQLKLFMDDAMVIAEMHFAREEQILTDLDYPGLQAQHHEHQIIFNKLRDYRDSLDDQYSAQIVQHSLAFVRDYWVHHMLDEARQFRAFMSQRDSTDT